MNAVLTNRAWLRKPAWSALARRLSQRLRASASRPREPHDWREIQSVLLDYERRKAEIGALVRSRAV